MSRPEAIAFFAAAKIAEHVFIVAHHGCDPLEAGVAVKQAHVHGLTDCFDGLGGHDGLHGKLIALEQAEFLVAGDDVVEKNHHDLVAVEQHIFTAVVAG